MFKIESKFKKGKKKKNWENIFRFWDWILRIPYVQKYLSYESDLFLKMFEIESKFRKWKKKLRKSFFF